MKPWLIDVDSPQHVIEYGMLLMAALAWAGTIVISRNFPSKMDAPSLLLWSFGLSFALLLLFSVASGTSLHFPANSMPYALFNGVIVAPMGVLPDFIVQEAHADIVSDFISGNSCLRRAGFVHCPGRGDRRQPDRGKSTDLRRYHRGEPLRKFRVWGRTMLLKEPSYAAPQTACDPG